MYHAPTFVILDELEKAMASIGHRLMIKYGLREAPDDNLIARWRMLTRTLIAEGKSAEVAGSTAAQQIFPGYQSVFYASEADDIVSLLNAAGDR